MTTGKLLFLTTALLLGSLFGAQVNLQAGQESLDVALFEAVKDGNERQVKQLLADGANVNARDEIDCTPLMEAAMFQQYSILNLLISSGACAHLKDKWGRDALYYAKVGGAMLGAAMGGGTKLALKYAVILKTLRDCDCCASRK